MTVKSLFFWRGSQWISNLRFIFLVNVWISFFVIKLEKLVAIDKWQTTKAITQKYSTNKFSQKIRKTQMELLMLDRVSFLVLKRESNNDVSLSILWGFQTFLRNTCEGLFLGLKFILKNRFLCRYFKLKIT